MANIKVLKPIAGCWSDPISGVDKEFLVKGLIESRFKRGEYLSTDEDLPYPVMKDPDCIVEHLELDMYPIRYSDILKKVSCESFYDEAGRPVQIERTVSDDQNGTYVIEWKKVNTDVHSLLVSVGNLVDFANDLEANNMKYMIPVIEMILDATDLPDDAPEESVIIIKF